MKRKYTFLRYLICGLIGTAIALAVFSGQGGFSSEGERHLYQALSDACFVPAVILMGTGALVFVSNEGVFDLLNFSIMRMISLFRRRDKREQLPKTFYDYKIIKHGKAARGYGFIILTGAFFLLLSIVFLLMYMPFE